MTMRYGFTLLAQRLLRDSKTQHRSPTFLPHSLYPIFLTLSCVRSTVRRTTSTTAMPRETPPSTPLADFLKREDPVLYKKVPEVRAEVRQ